MQGIVVGASCDALELAVRRFRAFKEDHGRCSPASLILPTLALPVERVVVFEMAAAWLRVPGFLSAAGSQTAGLIVPLRTPTRFFHSSHWALRELQTKSQPGEQIYEEGEYNPQKKAWHPMKIVGIAWAIGFPSGIILFLLTKRQVEKNRLKQLKVRQRLKASNEGEYARERYQLAALGTEEVTETKT